MDSIHKSQSSRISSLSSPEQDWRRNTMVLLNAKEPKQSKMSAACWGHCPASLSCIIVLNQCKLWTVLLATGLIIYFVFCRSLLCTHKTINIVYIHFLKWQPFFFYPVPPPLPMCLVIELSYFTQRCIYPRANHIKRIRSLPPIFSNFCSSHVGLPNSYLSKFPVDLILFAFGFTVTLNVDRNTCSTFICQNAKWTQVHIDLFLFIVPSSVVPSTTSVTSQEEP